MTSKHPLAAMAACFISVTFLSSLLAEQVDVAPHVAKLRAVGPKGAGHREAAASWKALSKADADQLTEILAGMNGVGRLSQLVVSALAPAVLKQVLQCPRAPDSPSLGQS